MELRLERLEGRNLAPDECSDLMNFIQAHDQFMTENPSVKDASYSPGRAEPTVSSRRRKSYEVLVNRLKARYCELTGESEFRALSKKSWVFPE